MDRRELGASLNLKVEVIPQDRPNRPGTPIKPESITIHNTSNRDSGADADAHSNFVRYKGFYRHEGRKVWVSWHYTVDDIRVIKQLPIHEKAFHVRGTRANRTSIAIETCMHKEIDQEKADDRAARLVAVLLYDLGLTTAEIVPHKEWTGKNCPVLILKKWQAFVSLVADYLEAINNPDKSIDDNVNIRDFDDRKHRFDDSMCWE